MSSFLLLSKLASNIFCFELSVSIPAMIFKLNGVPNLIMSYPGYIWFSVQSFSLYHECYDLQRRFDDTSNNYF